MIVLPRTSVQGTCLTTVGRLLLSAGTLSCRSEKSPVELQHHQWHVHQLVMMESGSGGIANGIVQQPAAHRRAGVGSPVHKRRARAAKKQSGQWMILQSGRTGTMIGTGNNIAGAGAHGTPAKRILACREVQMRTAIGRL